LLQAILFDDEAWNVMGDDDADLLDLNSDTKNKDVVTGESLVTANSLFVSVYVCIGRIRPRCVLERLC
jgi:hypothetical protein